LPFWSQSAVGSLCRSASRERSEQPLPATFRVEDAAHLVAAFTVAIETTMLELDAGAVVSFGDEADLHLGFQIRVVLPVARNLPRQDEPGGRLPSQDSAHVAGAPVAAAFVPAAAVSRLDHRVHCFGLADHVSGEGPPASHLLGEDTPGNRLRCIHRNDLAQTVHVFATAPRLIRHRFFSMIASRAAASWNAASASSQKPSSHSTRP